METILKQLTQQGLPGDRLARFRKEMDKARRKDNLKALDRLVRKVDGEPRIISDPPLVVPIEELVSDERRREVVSQVKSMLVRYRESLKGDRAHLFDEYHYAHLAHKVVGVGSVGTRAWLVLMVGRDDGDPLFLQAKQAEASVLEPHAGASEFDNPGRRVVEGQLLCTPALGRKALNQGRGPSSRRSRDLRSCLWLDPGPGPCPLRR